MSLVISIVGRSNSGKTTLLEKLISELVQRGHNIATFKHCAHGFELDQPGKDSWRFAEAGSSAVVLSSAHKFALIKSLNREVTLEELYHLLDGGFDLVLVEGFSSDHATKIEVHRKGFGDLISTPDELLAVVTDEPLDINVSQYSHGEIGALAGLIEQRASDESKEEETFLLINDTAIPLDPSIGHFIHKTLLGMVSALRGTEEVRSLRISLRRGIG